MASARGADECLNAIQYRSAFQNRGLGKCRSAWSSINLTETAKGDTPKTLVIFLLFSGGVIKGIVPNRAGLSAGRKMAALFATMNDRQLTVITRVDRIEYKRAPNGDCFFRGH